MVRPFHCVDLTCYRKRREIVWQGARGDQIGKTQQPMWPTPVSEGSKRRDGLAMKTGKSDESQAQFPLREIQMVDEWEAGCCQGSEYNTRRAHSYSVYRR
jgi:hypothetical protein